MLPYTELLLFYVGCHFGLWELLYPSLMSTIAFNIFVEVLLMFLDYLNSTLWYNICFILFYPCFCFLCKLFLIVVQKEKLKLYSLWLMYFQINKILVVLYGCRAPGKTANVDYPKKAALTQLQKCCFREHWGLSVLRPKMLSSLGEQWDAHVLSPLF